MKRADWILFVAVSLLSSAWAFSASRQLGATFDEPFYLEAGLDYWHRGHFGSLLAAGTMPLAPHLQTLPVAIAEYASGRTWSVERDLGEMLRLARPVTLVFWIVLLAATMRLGRHLGGDWSGRAALLLIAVEPNFLAHASLATTDIALAACFAMCCAEFLTRRHQTARWRIGVAALWFGLALTAKVSALALLPFLAVAAYLEAPRERPALRRVAADLFWVAAIGFIFAVVYCGSGGHTWLSGTLSAMPADHALRPLVAWLGSLRIFPNALYAMWFQFSHNQAGQAVFIAGHADTRAVWFYVPVLLSIKLSVPLLVAIVIALALPRSRARTLATAAALIVATMVIFQVQTGIRFLLPLLALAIAWAGARIGALVPQSSGAVRGALAAVLAAMIIESSFVWPDAIRYVNALWGGVDAGYRVVSDSNYDWGQGLPELEKWRLTHDWRVSAWYFGTDTRFPEITRINPRLPDFDPRALEGRVLAVSASLINGGYLETPGPARDFIERIRAMTPLARTSTFFLYEGVR